MALNFSNSDDKYIIYSRADGNKGIPLSQYKILNMPFQFPPLTDPRISKSLSSHLGETSGLGTTYGGGEIGRVYDKTIIRNCPVIIIRPGRPDFMKSGMLFGGDDEYKNKMINSLAQNWDSSESEGSSMAEPNVEEGNGKTNVLRYYDFKRAYASYCTYVTRIVRSFAYAMNDLEGNEVDPEHNIRSYRSFNLEANNWGSSPSHDKDTAGYNMISDDFVSFYLDGASSYGESFSNATGESAISSKLKGVDKMTREGQFLFGANWSTAKAGNAQGESVKNQLNESLGTGTGNVLNNSLMANAFSTILSGGNMLFPEIWDDSSYSKDYSITIRLFSPYGDPYSIFTNIYVPLAHLMGLVLPVQSSSQGYEGPFIVKTYVRGMFSCDLGMFSGMSVRKGEGGSWTVDGLPTELDVEMNLKDLYSTIMMSVTNSNLGILFGNNTGLIEYIYALSGVEMYSSKRLFTKLKQTIGGAILLPKDVLSSGASVVRQKVKPLTNLWNILTSGEK